MSLNAQSFLKDICKWMSVIKDLRLSSPKLSKMFALMKHCNKKFVMKQFLKKTLSVYFGFLFKRLVDWERKHLSCHRLLVKISLSTRLSSSLWGSKVFVIFKLMKMLSISVWFNQIVILSFVNFFWLIQWIDCLANFI